MYILNEGRSGYSNSSNASQMGTVKNNKTHLTKKKTIHIKSINRAKKHNK